MTAYGESRTQTPRTRQNEDIVFVAGNFSEVGWLFYPEEWSNCSDAAVTSVELLLLLDGAATIKLKIDSTTDCR